MNRNRIISAVLGIVAGLLVAFIFFADFGQHQTQPAEDIRSKAEKVFVPYGEHDDYYLFSSGGHSGQLFVYGIPSMRKLELCLYLPQTQQQVMAMIRQPKKC